MNTLSHSIPFEWLIFLAIVTIARSGHSGTNDLMFGSNLAEFLGQELPYFGQPIIIREASQPARDQAPQRIRLEAKSNRPFCVLRKVFEQWLVTIIVGI
jgi:hypothetical protein